MIFRDTGKLPSSIVHVHRISFLILIRPPIPLITRIQRCKGYGVVRGFRYLTGYTECLFLEEWFVFYVVSMGWIVA